jgi:hypothetical protein
MHQLHGSSVLPGDRAPVSGDAGAPLGARPGPGGPSTPQGKEAARRNALKHGLCADLLLPEVLQPGRIALYLAQLAQEHRPATPTEEILVAELARHAAALELGQEAEGAVLRQGASQLSAILSPEARQDPCPDAVLAAAVATDALERFARYRRGHEKAFFTALQRLREQQAVRSEPRPSPGRSMAEPFVTEAACAAFLESRFRRAHYRCPECGHDRGYWIAARCCWQCAHCAQQTGLRAGTVMASSPLPLVTWFAAIRLLLAQPGLSARELGRTLELRRPATARMLAKKIRTAMASPRGPELLAGLDDYFRAGGGPLPEGSVRKTPWLGETNPGPGPSAPGVAGGP